MCWRESGDSPRLNQPSCGLCGAKDCGHGHFLLCDGAREARKMPARIVSEAAVEPDRSGVYYSSPITPLAQRRFSLMAELKVYSTIGVRSAAEDLFARYETSSGHKLAVTWGTAPMLVKRIEGGETADVLILSRAGLDALSKQGKVLAGSEAPLASSGVGIAVKTGARKPDISTPEALKQTLLNAKSIAYSEPSAGGASGVYFEKLLGTPGHRRRKCGKRPNIWPAGRLLRHAPRLRRGRARCAAKAGASACRRLRSGWALARRSQPRHRLCGGSHDG